MIEDPRQRARFITCAVSNHHGDKRIDLLEKRILKRRKFV